MPEWVNVLVANEGPLRLAAFAGVLALLLVLQRLRPLRGDGRGQRRQATNLLLIALDTALLRLAFPVSRWAWPCSWNRSTSACCRSSACRSGSTACWPCCCSISRSTGNIG